MSVAWACSRVAQASNPRPSGSSAATSRARSPATPGSGSICICNKVPVECVCTRKYSSRAGRGPGTRRYQMAQTAVQGQEYQGVSIPPTGTYELDAVHTVVGLAARHMLSKVRGQFTEFTGTIEVGDSPEDSRVEVEVKTDSITTHTEKRDQHLMSGDFLEIETHPVLTFTRPAVRPTGRPGSELEGA